MTRGPIAASSRLRRTAKSGTSGQGIAGLSYFRLVALTSLVMLAFAGNSILCRLALRDTALDPASFTTIRVASGALALWLLTRRRGDSAAARENCEAAGGNWLSACALLAYAAGFSFAYVTLPASTGALLLFGAVQMTMIGYGLARGERFGRWQVAGLVGALAGLVALVAPGLVAPPLVGAVLMLGAGGAWGVYSLRGRGAQSPARVTAGNFLRAAPIAAALSAITYSNASFDGRGLAYAVMSGAVTSGLGYAIWYAVLPSLRATSAAIVQLSVPVIAAFGGVALLDEPLTTRLVASSLAILGGILLVLLNKRPPPG